jgi:hypothetical protein
VRPRLDERPLRFQLAASSSGQLLDGRLMPYRPGRHVALVRLHLISPMGGECGYLSVDQSRPYGDGAAASDGRRGDAAAAMDYVPVPARLEPSALVLPVRAMRVSSRLRSTAA